MEAHKTTYGSIKNMTSDKRVFKFTGTALKEIDYVIVYSKAEMEQHPDKNEEREKFQSALKRKGFTLEETVSPSNEDHVFVKLMASYELLCEEAEKIKLEMPIEVNDSYEDELGIVNRVTSCLETDTEVDFITAPFLRSRKYIFQNYQNEEEFFPTRLRLYLTHHIIIRLDLDGGLNRCKENLGKKKALPYLLMKKVYIDRMIMHDVSIDDPYFEELKKKWMMQYYPEYEQKTQEEKLEMIENGPATTESSVPTIDEINRRFDFQLNSDARHSLNETWPKLYKFQPSWKIRNYFGEKVAFYYAWSGHLIAYLWLPMLLGLAVFTYGLYENIANKPAELDVSQANVTQSVLSAVENMLNTFKLAFDNAATPYFALVICVWGTILTEMWKRYKHRLAYEWDVDSFDSTEPDRAQFKATVTCKDPITKEDTMTYPTYRRLMKFGASVITLVFMIIVVLIAVAGVIVYRVVVTVRVCPTVSSTTCLILNMIISALLNAAAILMLGKLYDLIAFYLTEWENHRTQTDYDDALIIKLFAFQFANSYTSLFYIAFFRGQSFVQSNGIFELGPNYVDNCGTNNNCMAMLSFQVLILMIIKPFPKFLKDIILPKLLEAIRKCQCKKQNKVSDSLNEEDLWEPDDVNQYINYQLNCTPLQDFTIDEYMEKVIQYGFLMLFAASFPLAPLVAFLTNLCDRYVDAKRLLWMYRRPVPFMVHTIGIWEPIVELVNAAGVISNACLIAFTSNWGKNYSFTDKLIIVISVEHAVFFLKFFLAAVIPDVPADVSLNIRREKFQIEKLLDSDIGNAKTRS